MAEIRAGRTNPSIEEILRSAPWVSMEEHLDQLRERVDHSISMAHTLRAQYRVDANDVRALQPGQAYLLAGGRAELCQVIQAPGSRAAPEGRPALPGPPRGWGRPAPMLRWRRR